MSPETEALLREADEATTQGIIPTPTKQERGSLINRLATALRAAEARADDAELAADGWEVFEDSAEQERDFHDGGVGVRYVGPWVGGRAQRDGEGGTEVTPRFHDYLRELGRRHVKRARAQEGGNG